MEVICCASVLCGSALQILHSVNPELIGDEETYVKAVTAATIVSLVALVFILIKVKINPHALFLGIPFLIMGIVVAISSLFKTGMSIPYKKGMILVIMGFYLCFNPTIPYTFTTGFWIVNTLLVIAFDSK